MSKAAPQTISPQEASRYCKFEDVKDELMSQAVSKNIGFREVKREFDGPGSKSLDKMELKRKFMNLGFKASNTFFGRLSGYVVYCPNRY